MQAYPERSSGRQVAVLQALVRRELTAFYTFALISLGQCTECHAEQTDHDLAKTTEMAFACKKCKKAFR